MILDHAAWRHAESPGRSRDRHWIAHALENH